MDNAKKSLSKSSAPCTKLPNLFDSPSLSQPRSTSQRLAGTSLPASPLGPAAGPRLIVATKKIDKPACASWVARSCNVMKAEGRRSSGVMNSRFVLRSVLRRGECYVTHLGCFGMEAETTMEAEAEATNQPDREFRGGVFIII